MAFTYRVRDIPDGLVKAGELAMFFLSWPDQGMDVRSLQLSVVSVIFYF